ncbi:MAG: hypothetical protein H6719_18910 [Sandaracinaceae bacterium]|nr:hypothetical protein [Sandaracinaceae bacterium]
MSIRVLVNRTELTIEATTTAAALFAELQPDVAPNAPGYWLLARVDGAKYIENPQRKEQLVTELFDDGEPAPLYLEQPPKCQHGSPAVQNRGFLCGWC